MLPCDNATRPAFIADAFRLVATRTISSERSIRELDSLARTETNL